MRKQETKEADPIRDYLSSLPRCFYFKVHGGLYQMTGLPDFIGCLDGRFFGLEQKTEHKKPGANQRRRLMQIRDAGGIAAIVRSLMDVKVALGQEKAGEETSLDLWDIDYVPIHRRPSRRQS
jgi:hypothetical protein